MAALDNLTMWVKDLVGLKDIAGNFGQVSNLSLNAFAKTQIKNVVKAANNVNFEREVKTKFGAPPDGVPFDPTQTFAAYNDFALGIPLIRTARDFVAENCNKSCFNGNTLDLSKPLTPRFAGDAAAYPAGAADANWTALLQGIQISYLYTVLVPATSTDQANQLVSKSLNDMLISMPPKYISDLIMFLTTI